MKDIRHDAGIDYVRGARWGGSQVGDFDRVIKEAHSGEVTFLLGHK